MNYTIFLTKKSNDLIEIVSSIIGLKSLNANPKLVFNQGHEIWKYGTAVRFVLEKVCPSYPGTVINKSHKPLIARNRGNRCWPLNIRVNEIKWKYTSFIANWERNMLVFGKLTHFTLKALYSDIGK